MSYDDKVAHSEGWPPEASLEDDLASAIAAENDGDVERAKLFLAALMSVTGLTIEELNKHRG